MKIIDKQTPVGLTISELAGRTGVPQATLRTWESRHGSPRPRRLPGGHRRYGEDDVALVAEILRLRASGLSLQSSIARARAVSAELEPSVFAGLRRRYPQLAPQVLSKPSLLALTRAIEDECCARAERPVLFASFQRAGFYRDSQARWEDLATTAEQVVVFAAFADHSPRGVSPVRVAVPKEAPLRREWLLVCDAPDYPACVTGWELPGQEHLTDSTRRFESVWTVDPKAVREAARICAGLAEAFHPRQDLEWGDRLSATPVQASPDLDRALSLFNRVVGYLDTAQR